MNPKINLTKQRNMLAVIILVCFALVCFLFWRLATIATKSQESVLIANVDKITRAQVEAQIDSIQKTWEDKLAFKEQELVRYKDMLEKKGSQTVAVVQTRLVYRDTGTIKTVVKYRDSLHREVIFDYPELSAEFNDEWIDLKMTANCDSFTYDLKTRDSIIVLFRSERAGFLKPKKTTAYLFSQSPYNVTDNKAIQSVVLPKRPNLFIRLYRAVFNGKN